MPEGYVADNSDCDDGDANEHPGQTWYKDLDRDSYSDGTTNTVSCTRPTGYYVASELTATSGDNDDNDSTVYPSSPELCDGKDNDQDGEVDEGCENDVIYVCDDGNCGENYPCYETITGGYLASGNGYEIMVSAGFYIENLILSKPIEVTLSGGWNNDYSENTGGQSTIGGSLTITGGFKP